MLDNNRDIEHAKTPRPNLSEDSKKRSVKFSVITDKNDVNAISHVIRSGRRSRIREKKIDFSSLAPFGQRSSKQSEKQQTLETLKEAIGNKQPEFVLSNNVETASTKQQMSSWGLSFFLHSLIVFILAFIFFPIKDTPKELEAVFSTSIGEQLDFLTEDEGNLNPNEAEKYKLDIPEELKIEDFLVFEKQELPFENNVAAPLFEQSRIDESDTLSGRTDPGLKNDLLSKYGGNKLTEESVALGLEWLRKQQNKDGSWSLKGPYADGIASQTVDNRPAATALALLAFQGAGNTRSIGEHSALVKRGWTWLLKQQNPDGSFVPEVHSSEALFYTQAICVIALCELITMEKNVSSRVRDQATRAVNFLLENQCRQYGGWKYVPQELSDLSVTGWCTLALKTAEMAKIKVPQTAYTQITKFLDSVSYDDGSGYVYQLVDGEVKDIEKRPSMTATGLMCREYLGWTPDNPTLQRGAATLVEDENLVRFPTTKEEKKDYLHNVYGWYSTSMALKGLGPYNKHWRRWNAALSKELPKNQTPKGVKEAGSWDPQYDEYSFGGGRLYVTCLSILCLEVYYRHLSSFR